MAADPISIILQPENYRLLELLTAADPEDVAQLLQAAAPSASARAALLTQLDLRRQGSEKFGQFARSMIFTRDGLEQATRLPIAALHAQRFHDGGAKIVADLGCGIGANAFALAGLGLTVRAWDLDPQAVAAALVNLRFFPESSVELGDVTELSLAQLVDEGVDAVFADPARRSGAQSGNRRIMDPAKWSPSLPQVLQWGQDLAAAGCDRLGVKVAPGIDYQWIPSSYRAQWVSHAGVLADASLWSPGLSPEGPGRTAVILTGEGSLRLRVDGDPSAPVQQVDTAPLGEFVWEPDAAIIRAGALAKFAAACDASGVVSPSIAYLTGNSPVPPQWAPAASCFQVLETVALKPKAIVAAARSVATEYGFSRAEVKKRGADIDPAGLQRQLNKALAKFGGAAAPANTPSSARATSSGVESASEVPSDARELGTPTSTATPAGEASAPLSADAAAPAANAAAPGVLTVIATRVNGRHRAILCRRV